MSGSNNYLSGTSFTFEPAANYNVTGINNVLIIGTANSIVSHAWYSGYTYAYYAPLANAVIAADTTTVGQQYGIDSVISKMYTAYRSNDPTTTCYLLPLPAYESGNPTTYIYSTISGSGSGTFGAATLNVYVAGTHVQAQILSGYGNADVTAAISNAINANPSVPVTATYGNDQVILDVKNQDIVAQDVDFRYNYAGALSGEFPVIGLLPNPVLGNIQYTSFLTPDVATPLANLASIQFDAIVTPYTDATSMAAYNTLLNQTSGRWSGGSKLFGHVFTAYKDTFANCVAFGDNYNTEFITTLALPGVNYSTVVGASYLPVPAFGTPTTVYEAAAYFAGAAVNSLAQDVGTPLQALPLTGILAEPAQSRFNSSELNSLLQNGMAVYKVGAGNVPILNRAVTMYQYNNLGIADDTFKDTTTMFVLEHVIETFLEVLGEQFARVRLVDPSTPIPQGSDFVSTTTIESAAIGVYSTLNVQGYVSYVSTFAQNVSATSLGNGTVKLYCPVTLASPLIQLQLNFVVALT